MISQLDSDILAQVPPAKDMDEHFRMVQRAADLCSYKQSRRTPLSHFQRVFMAFLIRGEVTREALYAAGVLAVVDC